MQHYIFQRIVTNVLFVFRVEYLYFIERNEITNLIIMTIVYENNETIQFSQLIPKCHCDRVFIFIKI